MKEVRANGNSKEVKCLLFAEIKTWENRKKVNYSHSTLLHSRLFKERQHLKYCFKFNTAVLVNMLIITTMLSTSLKLFYQLNGEQNKKFMRGSAHIFN